MSPLELPDGTYARIVLAARIENLEPAEFVQEAVAEYFIRHRAELLEAHQTEATILLAERPTITNYRVGDRVYSTHPDYPGAGTLITDGIAPRYVHPDRRKHERRR